MKTMAAKKFSQMVGMRLESSLGDDALHTGQTVSELHGEPTRLEKGNFGARRSDVLQDGGGEAFDHLTKS